MHDSSGKALYFEQCKDTVSIYGTIYSIIRDYLQYIFIYIKWINADMMCLMFDVSNKESFGHIKFWYEKVKNEFQNDKNIIGNIFKCVFNVYELF